MVGGAVRRRSQAVCGGAVEVIYSSHSSLGWDVPREEENFDLVVWSYGVHPVSWTDKPPSTGPTHAMVAPSTRNSNP